MKRLFASLAFLALTPAAVIAAKPYHHGPRRAIVRTVAGVHSRAARAGRGVHASPAPPKPALAPQTDQNARISQLPPTAPTVRKTPATQKGIAPSMPQPQQTIAPGNAGVSGAVPTVGLAAPGQLPAPGSPAVLPRNQAATSTPAAASQAAAVSPSLQTGVSNNQAIQTASPLQAPPQGTGAAQPTAVSGAPTVAHLPPGPLSTSPINISAAPNEIRVTGLGSSSAPWSVVLLLTFLTLIPSLLICVTPFARLLVVFHFLRQALGLQTTPSNQTLIGLTLILTFFIMEPVGRQVYERSFVPLESGQITPFEAIARGKEPLRNFMVHYVREKDAALFLEIAKEPKPHDVRDLSMRVLVPAYIVSELKSGFQIGAVLFLPFLVVDMVVASITTSVGMMQLPPVVISTPLKLMLFLMVDGWHLLIGALMRSFA